MLKLNSDGCARGDPGAGGDGSILRDGNGVVLWAQADAYGLLSNMVAESLTLL